MITYQSKVSCILNHFLSTAWALSTCNRRGPFHEHYKIRSKVLVRVSVMTEVVNIAVIERCSVLYTLCLWILVIINYPLYVVVLDASVQ